MPSTPRYRIILADDHTMVAEGLARLIESEFELVAKVEDGHQAVEACREFHPDAILMDISMPRMGGIEAARLILAENPKVKVIFITMHANPTYVREALRLGASGYILKRSAVSEISVAVAAAMKGKTYVTPLVPGPAQVARGELENDLLTIREREVLQLVAEGRTAKEIARLLNIS